MKLSDIRGEDTLDVLADLIVPTSNIAMDKRMSKLFEKSPVPEGKTSEEAAAERLRDFVPAIIKSHKSDVIAILAAISMRDRAEYESRLNMANLLADLADLINDEEFVGFFTSAVTEQTSTDG